MTAKAKIVFQNKTPTEQIPRALLATDYWLLSLLHLLHVLLRVLFKLLDAILAAEADGLALVDHGDLGVDLMILPLDRAPFIHRLGWLGGRGLGRRALGLVGGVDDECSSDEEGCRDAKDAQFHEVHSSKVLLLIIRRVFLDITG